MVEPLPSMNLLVALFAGVQLLGLFAVLAAYRRAPLGVQGQRGFEVVREPSVATGPCAAVVRAAA
jgi:hypothetical protein